MRKHSRPWRAIQVGVAQAVKGAGGVAIVDAVADTMTAAVKDSGRSAVYYLEAVSTAASSAIMGAADISDRLGCVAKGFLEGLLRATGETGEEALVTIEKVSGSFVENAGILGADVAGATKGLVSGAISMADELGLDEALAASAAAQAALDAGYAVSVSAGENVRLTLKRTIDGVKVVVKEPFHAHKHS